MQAKDDTEEAVDGLIAAITYIMGSAHEGFWGVAKGILKTNPPVVFIRA